MCDIPCDVIPLTSLAADDQPCTSNNYRNENTRIKL